METLIISKKIFDKFYVIWKGVNYRGVKNFSKSCSIRWANACRWECLYLEIREKNPNMLIQRTVAPNGNYAIQLSENGKVFKKISKCFMGKNSELVDTFDFRNGKGIYLSSVDASENGPRFYKVFDKVKENGITQDGLIYLIRKDDSYRYQCNIRTFDGSTSFPKTGTQFSWFVKQFAELFGKG